MEYKCKIVKLISCIIPNKKLRKRFRSCFAAKTSILENNGVNNKLILLDDNGFEIKNCHYKKNLRVRFLGSNNIITIFYSQNIDAEFVCHNNTKVEIGKSPYKQCFTKPVFIWNQSQLLIGENVSIDGVKIYLANEPNLKVKIGNDCMISRNIIIRSNDAHTIYDIKTKKVLNYPSDINIGNHCWIGENVSILKGANIPDNSVLGFATVYTQGSNTDIASISGGVSIWESQQGLLRVA